MARQATAASIRSEFHTELDQSTALFGATPQVQSQRAQAHTKIVLLCFGAQTELRRALSKTGVLVLTT